MKQIAGYLLIIVGIILVIFFRNYNGNSIPHPFLYLLAGILISFAGGYIAFGKSKKTGTIRSDPKMAWLKLNGEQIKVSFDNCVFKTNTFQQEVFSEFPSGTELYDGLYNSGRSHNTENKTQTVLVYTHQADGNTEKFISPIFPADEVILKFHVTNGDIMLYVDRSDRKNYRFEIRG